MKYERLNKRGVLISYLNPKRDKLSRFNSYKHFFVVLLHFKYYKALGIQKGNGQKKMACQCHLSVDAVPFSLNAYWSFYVCYKFKSTLAYDLYSEI